MNRDPEDYGDDNDECGNQQVANHLGLRSGFGTATFYPVRSRLNSTNTRWTANTFVYPRRVIPVTSQARPSALP